MAATVILALLGFGCGSSDTGMSTHTPTDEGDTGARDSEAPDGYEIGYDYTAECGKTVWLPVGATDAGAASAPDLLFTACGDDPFGDAELIPDALVVDSPSQSSDNAAAIDETDSSESDVVAPLTDGLGACDEQYAVGNVVTADEMSAGCVLPDGSISIGVLDCSDGSKIWSNDVDRWARSGSPVQQTAGAPVDDADYKAAWADC